MLWPFLTIKFDLGQHTLSVVALGHRRLTTRILRSLVQFFFTRLQTETNINRKLFHHQAAIDHFLSRIDFRLSQLLYLCIAIRFSNPETGQQFWKTSFCHVMYFLTIIEFFFVQNPGFPNHIVFGFKPRQFACYLFDNVARRQFKCVKLHVQPFVRSCYYKPA